MRGGSSAASSTPQLPGAEARGTQDCSAGGRRSVLQRPGRARRVRPTPRPSLLPRAAEASTSEVSGGQRWAHGQDSSQHAAAVGKRRVEISQPGPYSQRDTGPSKG